MLLIHPERYSGVAHMMSDDDLEQSDACEADPEVLAAWEREELFLLKKMFALPDSRRDPGVYRNPDSDALARDLVELDMILSSYDPRPLKSPWRLYESTEDFAQRPVNSQNQEQQ